MTTKVCSRCAKEKSLDEFGTGGRQAWCRSCKSAYQQARRTKERESTLEDQRCQKCGHRQIPRYVPETDQLSFECRCGWIWFVNPLDRGGNLDASDQA